MALILNTNYHELNTNYSKIKLMSNSWSISDNSCEKEKIMNNLG